MKHSAQWAASFLANPQDRHLQCTSTEKRKGMTKWGNKLIYLCSLDSVCQETRWSLALRDRTKRYPRNRKVKEMWDCNRCLLGRVREWWERVTQNLSKWCGRVSWGKPEIWKSFMAHIWFSNVQSTPVGVSKSSTHVRKAKIFVLRSVWIEEPISPPSLVSVDGQELPHHQQTADNRWGKNGRFPCSLQCPTATGLAEWHWKPSDQDWDAIVWY